MKNALLRSNVTILILAVIAIVIALGVTAVLMRPTMEEPSPSEMLPTATNTTQENESMDEITDETQETIADQEVMNEPKELPRPIPPTEPVQKGSYETYSADKIARAATGNVVLFFHAPWCPYCRALDTDIDANRSAIPNNLTILKTDYDSETALKQKYGVTYQHTMVQVDAQGNLLKKWSGSATLSALTANVQ